MNHLSKIFLLTSLMVTPATCHSQESLYLYCLSHWSSQATGETCYGWAKEHDIPDLPPIGTRSSSSAFIICQQEFDDEIEQITDPIKRASLCWKFAIEGPKEWR